MNAISKFFTLYWIVYFPTCIAFNDLPGFSIIDEAMTIILIVFTFLMRGHRDTNPEPWKEFYYFLLILTGYIIYSLIRRVNVVDAVWLELMQQIRPYSIIYCTWILNPRFCCHTFFVVTWTIQKPEIVLQDPKGKKYKTSDFKEDKLNIRSARLQIPGIAEVRIFFIFSMLYQPIFRKK